MGKAKTDAENGKKKDKVELEKEKEKSRKYAKEIEVRNVHTKPSNVLFESGFKKLDFFTEFERRIERVEKRVCGYRKVTY